MDRTSVSSSNIRSVGYDPATKTLEVEFHSGGLYQYHQVPQSIYDGLMAASSHGRYLEQNVKGVYDYTKF